MSNLSPFQFSMFEPAGKLADPEQTSHGDLGDGTYEGLKAHKIDTAKSPRKLNLYDNIRRNGVERPVEVESYQGRVVTAEVGVEIQNVDKPVLKNGHHRVFSAADIDPGMEVPVRWRR